MCAAPDPYVGVTLDDRFTLEAPLASGAMARVYVATDRSDGSRVAVKVLPPRPKGEATVERMRREAIALERLDHPNIVRTLAHGPSPEGGYHIALELIEGPSITTFVRDNALTPDGSIRLLLQVCSALRHAHRKGIVHRDLKSSNLLVASEDRNRARVKLIDFGVVKLADEETLSGNQMLGSVHTISPEQIKQEPVDHRADIYAVGVLAYRLLSGQYPYHSKVAAETISKHVHAPVPRLEDPTLPEGVADIVQKCMAKSPDDRYRDVQALMDALSDCLEVPTAMFTKPFKLPVPSLPPAPLHPGGPDPVHDRTVALAAGGALLLAAAAALLWILS